MYISNVHTLQFHTEAGYKGCCINKSTKNIESLGTSNDIRKNKESIHKQIDMSKTVANGSFYDEGCWTSKDMLTNQILTLLSPLGERSILIVKNNLQQSNHKT